MSEQSDLNDINREDEQREDDRSRADRTRYRDYTAWCEKHNTYYSSLHNICPDCYEREKKMNDLYALAFRIFIIVGLFIFLAKPWICE